MRIGRRITSLRLALMVPVFSLLVAIVASCVAGGEASPADPVIEITREVPYTVEVEVTREVLVTVEVEVTRELLVTVVYETEITREYEANCGDDDRSIYIRDDVLSMLRATAEAPPETCTPIPSNER